MLKYDIRIGTLVLVEFYGVKRRFRFERKVPYSRTLSTQDGIEYSGEWAVCGTSWYRHSANVD